MNDSFANSIGAMFKQVFRTQAPQPSDNQAQQTTYYSRIVKLPSNSAYLMGHSTLDHSVNTEDMDLQWTGSSSNGSPHIEITTENHAGSMNSAHSHHSDSEPVDITRGYLSSLYPFQNSFTESYGSFSEASFISTPQDVFPDTDMTFFDTAMLHRHQGMLQAVDSFSQPEVPPDYDFNIGEVYDARGDIQLPLNAQLIPTSNVKPQLVVNTNQSTLSPLASATSGGTMANTSPMSDSSYLSMSSPIFSDSGNTASTFGSPPQPYLSPILASGSLDRSGYPLSRSLSSGKIRKPSPDLLWYADEYGKRRYKCRYLDCKYTSPRPNNLREHQESHDPNRPKPWKCCRCKRAFARKNDCKRHFTKVHIKITQEEDPDEYARLQEDLLVSLIRIFPPHSLPHG